GRCRSGGEALVAAGAHDRIEGRMKEPVAMFDWRWSFTARADEPGSGECHQRVHARPSTRYARARKNWPRWPLASLASVALAMLAAFATAPASAQSYPNRPITLVIPLPPGGTNDIMARAVADKLSASLGQQVVIENRAAGGSGTVGTRQVAKSAPDGYTLLLGYTSTLATGPSMHANAGYDPRKDFAPVGLIAVAPSLLLVHPSLPVGSAADLIALMRRATPPLQVGVPGIGTVNHLAAVLFAQQAGVEAQLI